MKPLGDKVVVRRDEPLKTTKGGLFIPDGAQEETQHGEVLAVGPGRILENGKRSKMELAKGDRVMFRKYAGHELCKEDRTVVLSESDVLGVLSDGE
jgi:chaperonin GroES